MEDPLGLPEGDEGNARVMKFVVRWPIDVLRAEEDWRVKQMPNQQNIIADVIIF